ncbi:MAG: hypothetical protein ACTJG9_05730 [Alcaligenes aquatilis]
MEETENCSQHDILLQGDVLKFDNKTAQRPFKLAVVINADCDIENGKHDGVLAILPIFKFSEYLATFWLPQFLDGQIRDASEQIKKLCTLEEEHIEELKRWITAPQGGVHFDSKKFIKQFELSEKKVLQVNSALERLGSALTSRTAMSLSSLRLFAPKDTVENDKKFIQNQVGTAFKGLGEGHLFMSEIKGDDDIGFVVRLRRIYSIEANNCFKSFSDYQARKKSHGDHAYRLCRLSPNYKFKLAQLFALQFSRIGLPNELINLSKLALENATNKIRLEQ